MLFYRRIDLNPSKVNLPHDLEQYIEKQKREMIELNKKREEERHRAVIRILHTKCFVAEENNRLTMKPFIESLLKAFLVFQRKKREMEKLLMKSNVTSTPTTTATTATTENVEKAKSAATAIGKSLRFVLCMRMRGVYRDQM